MEFIEKIQDKYAGLSIVGKLIAVISSITIALWIIGYFLPIVPYYLKMPGDIIEVLLQPWGIITYAFLHSGTFHLLFNMLILWYAGNMILNLFTGRRFLTLFFVGVMAGAALFTLSHTLFPGFVRGANGLVGSSAGVYATLFFMCTYTPEMGVRLFMFNIKLKYIAYALIAMDVIAIATQVNQGGSIAHLGGAFIGYYFATSFDKGRDPGEAFAKAGDYVADIFKPRPKQPKSRMKTVHRRPKKARSTSKANKPASSTEKQKKIDAILDKISEKGYDSLSKEEKDFLFKQGRDN